MKKFITFLILSLGRLLANERGDFDLDAFRVELSDFKKGQEAFLKTWDGMKGQVDILIKERKEGNGISEITQKLSKFEAFMGAQEDALESIKNKIKSLDEFRPIENSEEKNKKQREIEKKAFEEYCLRGRVVDGLCFEKGGKIHRVSVEQKDFSIGVGSEGGVLVRPEYATEILALIKDENPIRKFAFVKSIGTNRWEILERQGSMQIVSRAEGAAVVATTTPSYKSPQRYITVYNLESYPVFTQESLDDPTFDLEAEAKMYLAEDFAIQEGANHINGDGVNKAKGILTYPAGTSIGQIEQINLGEAAGLTANSYDGLVKLQNEARFDGNNRWMFNRKTRGLLRVIKMDGKPLWAPGFSLEQGNTILGDEYFVAAAMPDVAANALSIVHGDFKKGYAIVDRFGMRTVRDIYTVPGSLKLNTNWRTGGDILRWDALKIGKIAV